MLLIFVSLTGVDFSWRSHGVFALDPRYPAAGLVVAA